MGTIDTLSSGIIHTLNPDQGVWGDQPPWQLVEVAKVGTQFDSGPELFGHVSDIDVDATGRVYVFDRQAQDVRVFDRDGSYVRTIGRPGRGPGEFSANGIAVDPTQRLWVFNPGNMRYSVFDSTGVLVKEMRRMVGAIRFPEWKSTFSSDGALYEAIGYRDYSGTQFRLARYDTIANVWVDTLPIPGFPENTKLFSGINSLTASGWWQGVKTTYRIANISFEGDTIRVVELAHDADLLAAAERDSALQYERELSQRVVRGEYDVETSLRSIFEQLVVDDRDHLWVMLSSDSGNVGTPFDIFDPSGRYLGQLETPHPVDRFVLPIVRGNRIYYVTRDELDVQYVVVVRIHGRM